MRAVLACLLIACAPRAVDLSTPLSQASTAYRERRDRDAERLLRQALASRPDDGAIRLALAAVLVRQHRDVEAEREIAAAGMEGAFAQRLKATLALRHGRVTQAEQLFGRLVARNAADAQAVLGLGVAAATRGDLPAAKSFLDGAARLAPRAALVFHNRALVEERLGERPAALADARLAVALDPLFPAARNNLGTELHAAGRSDEARVELAAAAALFPDYAPARGNFGALLLLGGDAPGAVRELEAASARAPRVPEHHFNLGIAWFRLGDRERAREAFRRVLEIDPAHGAALRNLRWLDGRESGAIIGDELPALTVARELQPFAS